MSYIRLINNAPVKYSLYQFKVDFPNVSVRRRPTDAALATFDIYPLVAVAAPEVDSLTHRVIELAPQLIDGNWTQVWEVIELSEAEQNQKAQQLSQQIAEQVQTRLDEFARTRNYSSMMSLCTYATSTNQKFQTEGQYGVEVRDATWATCYQILGEAMAGLRDIPHSLEDIESELPVLAWPQF
jgi:hypothetical protein